MHPIVGTWKLDGWSSGGVEPFGAAPEGTLVYTAEGTIIAAFMRRGRRTVAASLDELAAWRRSPGPGDLEQGFLQAAKSFNAYSGRYTVQGDRVHHDVDVALYPDWIGQRLTRTFVIEGERLALAFGSDVLRWTRLTARRP